MASVSELGPQTSGPLAAQLLGAAAAAAPGAVSAEAANFRFWTRGADPLSEIEAGELVYDAGGLQTEQPGRTRMLAIPGPEATLRGLAQLVAWIANLSGDESTWLTQEAVARALLIYNEAYLGVAKRSDGTYTMEEWRVGMRLPLPIEIELEQGAVKRLVASKAKLEEWAGPDHWKPQWEALLAAPAAPLPVGDPDALAKEVRDRLALPWDADGLGAELRIALLTNPYAAVLRFVETMRQLRGTQPQRRREMVLALLGEIQPEPAKTLGWTTGGHAALRIAWPVLTDAEADARALVAAALGLQAKQGGGWAGPLEVGPAVLPEEPPLTAAQAAKVTGGVTELHAMVLGRAINAGRVGVYAGWRGPAHAGVLAPGAFVAAHPQVLGGNPTPLQQAALDVVIQIAGNEGRLDAGRAQDSALLSSGIQQWSVHVNEELTVLLDRFRRNAPEHYDALFGLYGLQVARWAPGGDATEATPPTPQQIAAANPYDGTKTSPYGANFASYVTFRQLAPGQPEAPLPPDSGQRRQRLAFFGGTPNPSGSGASFTSAWSARVRLAALASTDYCIAQIDTAVFRFQRVLDRPRAVKAPFTQGADPRALYSSQLGAALLLDEHVNRPFAQPASIERGLTRTLNALPNPFTTGTELSPTWLMAHTIDYMHERALRAKKGGGWETDPLMVTRNAHILKQNDRGLSPIPGSFKGWPAGA